jgi:hypothetical protein
MPSTLGSPDLNMILLIMEYADARSLVIVDKRNLEKIGAPLGNNPKSHVVSIGKMNLILLMG